MAEDWCIEGEFDFRSGVAECGLPGDNRLEAPKDGGPILLLLLLLLLVEEDVSMIVVVRAAAVGQMRAPLVQGPPSIWDVAELPILEIDIAGQKRNRK